MKNNENLLKNNRKLKNHNKKNIEKYWRKNIIKKFENLKKMEEN